MNRWMIFAVMAVFLTSCGRDHVQQFSRQSTAMDTYLSVTLYDENVSQEQASVLIDSAFSEIRRVESLMTDYSDSSEVGRINLAAGKETTQVSSELSRLLIAARQFSEESNGAFDVSVGPFVKAWDFLTAEPEIPLRGKIRMLRQIVGFRKITLDERRVYLQDRGMRIDLGAIAKGHAVDQAIDALKRNGVKHAIVDLGGNLGVWWEGTHSLDSTVAEILVRHPRIEGKYFGALRVGSSGISTSGDYQLYFVKNGTRYHHILDPKTGYPASDVVSVTIIADDAMHADALSTLVFVLGREKGMQLIRKHKGVDGLIVWEEGDSLRYELSDGLKNIFVRADD